MASQTEICNAALTRLGVSETIQSITESSAPAIALNAVWTIARQATLASFPWSFSLAEQDLVQLSSVDPKEWEYAYQLPTSNFLRLLKINDVDIEDAEYVVYGTYLYYDGDTVNVTYQQDISSTSSFSAQFTSAFAWRLAAEVAITMGRGEVMPKMMEQFVMEITGARTTDGARWQKKRKGPGSRLRDAMKD